MGRVLARIVEVVIGALSATTESPLEGRLRTIQLITFAAALCILAGLGLTAWLLER